MTKLRVVILALNYSPELTGIAPYVSSLAQSLSTDGHDVRVVTSFPHYPAWEIPEKFDGMKHTTSIESGVEVNRLRPYLTKDPSFLQRSFIEASFGSKLSSNFWVDADVLLCVSPALISTAIAIARARSRSLKNRPAVCIWVQDLYSLGVVETGLLGRRAARLVSDFEARVLKSADGIAVIHDRFRDHLVNSLHVPKQKIKTIQNWSHISNSPAADREQTRLKLGWAEDDVIVLHAGNMGVKQGLDHLLAPARLSTELGLKVRFCLMGGGSQRRAIEELSAEIDNLEVINSVEESEFSSVLSAADLLLVHEKPGVSEMAVPSKLTSYFLSGRPVIAATDPNGVTADEVSRSGGGMVVQAGDANDLIRGIQQIAADTELSNRFGSSGQAYALTHLSKSVATENFSLWLQSVVRESSKKANSTTGL